MIRSLHMKLVMIIVLLILSLMTVVGAFLVNSVMAFYLDDFYTQMQSVFQQEELVSDLRTPNEGEEDGGEVLLIAHNADFDTGFIRAAAQRNGMVFPNPYLAPWVWTAAAASCIFWTVQGSILPAATAGEALRRSIPTT